jgi:hypothetical protein
LLRTTSVRDISIAIAFLLIGTPCVFFADADFGYFDENRDGKISRVKFVDKPSEFIMRYDKNADCRVTQDEIKGASTDEKPAGHQRQETLMAARK